MTFYFYDLETSGVNSRDARVMQFGGQRTDMQLNPIGEPHNILIKLTPDALPEPDAVLITGITPQMTIADGITEAEFLKIFQTEIAVPDTIFVGFNSIRFDDEFMRFMNYRNFYDPYEWQWKDQRSRWDILDVVRMTRALRPDGIKWPVDSEGKASNRLELLTALNKLDHQNAHDALADVNATIAVARMIQQKQPKLFSYLLGLRQKSEIAKLVCGGESFVYSSGKYPSEFEKTTIVSMLHEHPKKQGAIVWDLRHDPAPFSKMSAMELAEAWKWKPYPKDGSKRAPMLPAKTMQFNRCPAIAPISVLDDASIKRLKLDMSAIEANRKKLENYPEFTENILKALELMNKEQQSSFLASEQDVDAQLYDDFVPDSDKTVMSAIRAAEPKDFEELALKLRDERLKALLPLYKARNFPKSLSDTERQGWERFIENRLMKVGRPSRIEKYFARIEELKQSPRTNDNQRYLLEELELYGQSIMP
jgi:exodeoxyribonuclease-1